MVERRGYMTRERFEQTGFKMSYEEICLGSKNLFEQKALQYGAESDIKRADEFTYIKGIYMEKLFMIKI